MHRLLSFDFETQSINHPKISALAAAALYGRGVFTTVAVEAARPFLWQKHWRRLLARSEGIGLEAGRFDQLLIAKALDELIEANGVVSGRARITFFDGGSDAIWDSGLPPTTHVLITTADRRPLTEPVRLTVSPFRTNSRGALVNIKSCNYLENILCRNDAVRRGFDDAVTLNERDEVVSTSMANLFWVKDGTIFTPALETGCLAGTTREFISENIAVEECRASINELDGADEIFLTSAGIGVCSAIMDAQSQPRREVTESVRKMIREKQLQPENSSS